MKQRLPVEKFNLPVAKIRSGYYSDSYFVRSKNILEQEHYNPHVVMQVFQRQHAVLCGIDHAVAILKSCADHPEELKIRALFDGDRLNPWDTVLTIEGRLADFVHLETVYLGVLSRQTKIATNVDRVVTAAAGKPVLFFPSRFDHYEVQAEDGYAAKIGGVFGVSTPANASYWNGEALGTIPHALIAAYGGNTLAATEAFDRHIDPAVNRVALVDFDNDCVRTSLEVARKFGSRLYGVRLDTADTLVDVSVLPHMGSFKPTGVCPRLVQNVRKALDDEGFTHVQIMVSGGFTAEKIAAFEAEKTPVNVYAVGASLFNESVNFTADIVSIDGKPCAKLGRQYRENPHLQVVE
ncbi:MAG TPA: nicotinate phosphoribosyltransferase [Negativicutes bacterium]|nr:nicotinate phosphoribosyltransferase [Negativicutes bacterium]